VSSGTSARRVPGARPSVDCIQAPKLSSEDVAAADQEQLVRVCVLCAEPVLAGYDAAPERNAAESDGTSSSQRGQLLVPPSVALTNPGIAPQEVFGELPRLQSVDAAFVAPNRRRPAVYGALRLEPNSSRPAHVMPRERLEPVLVLVRPDMPEPPPHDRLGTDLAQARHPAYDGTGSSTGSSAGAGIGTGSSSGAISISRSVSGAPISIAASLNLRRRRRVVSSACIGNLRQKLQRRADSAPRLFPHLPQAWARRLTAAA
jgi:hypothetical protein